LEAARIYKHTYTSIQKHMYTHTRVYRNTCTHIHEYTETHVHTYVRRVCVNLGLWKPSKALRQKSHLKFRLLRMQLASNAISHTEDFLTV